MKKSIIILLVILCFILSGCSSKSQEQQNEITTTEKTVEIKFYNEYNILPTIDSVIDAGFSGNNTSSENGVFTSIKYNYYLKDDPIQDYLEILNDYGFTYESSTSNYSIMIDGTTIAVISSTGGNFIELSIIPAKQTTSSNNQITTNSSQNNKTKDLKIGDKIVTESYEFTLKNVEFTYELMPSNTSSAYTSYPAESGKVYIHIDGEYKNTSKKDVCIRDLPVASADYDNGYKYNGFAVVDDGDNSFDWASSYVICMPLETCHYHCLIECPEIVNSGKGNLYITLPLADGNTYKYNIR